MTTGTTNTPTPLTTTLRIPLCFYCDRELVERSELHYCGDCRKWFRVTWVVVPSLAVTI